jgi:uncharacterized protein (DUF885 family)
MRLFLTAILASCMFASCNNSAEHAVQHNPQTDDSFNMAFAQLSASFIESLWAIEPEWATTAGYHKYDAVLPIPDSNRMQAQINFADAFLDSLARYDNQQLTASHHIDLLMMRNQLASKKWSLTTLKSYEWDPSMYNPSGLIAFMLSEQYDSLPARLRNAHQRIKSIPAYYDAARKMIQQPVAELTQLAIDQNTGGLSVFTTDFIDSVKASALGSGEQAEMIASAHAAADAVKDFVRFLKTRLNSNGRSFRLGRELYEQKFAYDIQSTSSAAQTYEAALARKQYLHAQMAGISHQLWSRYFGNTAPPPDTLRLIARMIDTLSSLHVSADSFQLAIERQIPELEQFINDKKLLYLDPSKPLVVRKEPAYMAGVAGVSISAPGPYDKEGNTYYNVGSLEGWPAARAESYLREYNHYILQILNIHEAIPGHYTQLVYANRSPSLVKSVLGNGAMIEGWAVYTEQMMLENGYGDNEPEMWLMWYKWHLRTVCNTLLDYAVHVQNMSRDEAMHLLINEAFQQKAEAEGKWKRVSVSSVQLTSYYAGYKAIYDLREELKRKEGKKFDLRIFHEKFLSYGSAPVKYIRELMLQ